MLGRPWLLSREEVLLLFPKEAEIFELCVGAERGRVLYRAVAGLLQGVLLGILLAALLVEIERPGSGGADGERFGRCGWSKQVQTGPNVASKRVMFGS